MFRFESLGSGVNPETETQKILVVELDSNQRPSGYEFIVIRQHTCHGVLYSAIKYRVMDISSVQRHALMRLDLLASGTCKVPGIRLQGEKRGGQNHQADRRCPSWPGA